MISAAKAREIEKETENIYIFRNSKEYIINGILESIEKKIDDTVKTLMASEHRPHYILYDIYWVQKYYLDIKEALEKIGYKVEKVETENLGRYEQVNIKISWEK